MAPKVMLAAYDLTGAVDAGVALAERAPGVSVSLTAADGPSRSLVAVLNTDTRDGLPAPPPQPPPDPRRRRVDGACGQEDGSGSAWRRAAARPRIGASVAVRAHELAQLPGLTLTEPGAADLAAANESAQPQSDSASRQFSTETCSLCHWGADMTTLMPREEFDGLFGAVCNWGRWGEGDELGTLNYIGTAEVLAACAVPRAGLRISLSKQLDTVAGLLNDRPLVHYMTASGGEPSADVKVHRDFIGVDFHGRGTSHIDGLAHIAYQDQMYNGRKASEVMTAHGSEFASIATAAHGIVARGVLLDVAHARRKAWIEPPGALTADELSEVADALHLEIKPGDVVFLRSGAVRRSAERGAWDVERESVGLHPSAMRWLAARKVSVLGGDGHGESRPSTVAGVNLPIHVLALVAMGMPMLDNLDLEKLSGACARARSFEFMVLIAPLAVPGGTGSPVNPIALL